MKHLLIAAYIFSIMYCYLQLDALINRCLDVFKERHPSFPVGDMPLGKGLRLYCEMLAISAVPVINICFGYFIATTGENFISSVVDTVEMNHLVEIREAEELTEKLEDLDKYF